MRKKLLSLLVLLMTAVTGAWAQEQSETIATTDYEVEGTHFTISNGGYYADEDGMTAVEGITVTAKNGETITKVVISCTYGDVNDGNTSVSSGTKEITNGGGTITVTGVNASTFTFTCSDSYPQFGQFVVYYGTAPAPTTYSVTLKSGTEDATNWQGKAGTGEYQDLPLTGLEAGTAVSVKYNGTKKVKSVKATKKAPAGPTYNETKSINDGPVTVAAGEHWLITGTGTQTTNAMSIGAGATVTLDGVNISSSSYCIKCLGEATIILKDGSTNTLTSTGDALLPALSIGDANTTLTIQGSTGVLNVESGDYCAGIGGGYSNTNSTCGNIRIEGGVITVQGGYGGAGIGTDVGEATCGDIIITGGTITANGGGRAAGIGGGTSDYGNTVCGNITIANTVTKVTATAGNQAPYSIGKGYGGSASCGTVTIGGVVGAITDSPFTYPVPAVPTLADVFTDGAVVGVAVKNTYDTYTVTGTYSGGSYTSYTKSSNDIEEVTMTKDGNNLVVWIKGDTNSECTLTFNTQDNTYTKSLKAGTGAAVWDLSEFVSITVNGTDITSTLEDVTPAAAETTITWTSSDMTSNFYANFDGWTNNNTHQGITVTGSGDAQGGWSQNGIDVNEGSGTITFTSSVGNIKSIVITADNMNNIDEWHVPAGWTANNTWDNPRTLSWNGTASTTVNLPLSNGQNFSNISTIVFTLE